MSNSFPTNRSPEADGADLEVTAHLVGQQIINILRTNFTSNGMMQRGDFYMIQTRELLQRRLKRIDIPVQSRIYKMCIKASEVNQGLDHASDSGVRRYVRALGYKRRSKEVYKEAKKACHQAINENFRNLIREYMRRGLMLEPLAPPGFQRTDRNESLSPSCAYAVDLNRANYQSMLTTEERLAFELQEPDASLQEMVASFTRAVHSDDSTDMLEPVPMMPPSIHCKLFDPRSISADAEREIFSPYSDAESEDESEEEEELSSEE